MQTSQVNQLIAAFKLGYITSIIEKELTELTNSNNKINILKKYLELLLLFENDFKVIFEDTITLFPKFRDSKDLEDFLSATFLVVHEKIESIKQPHVELAFFSGGVLAVSYDEDLSMFSEEKLTEILNLLFRLCNKENYEVENLISKVLSSDLYECMIARNSICDLFIGNKVSEEQKNAFRYLDKVVVNK